MIIYVTYVQNGVKKKGSLKEGQYQQLLSNPSVSEVETYPSARLMEMAFGNRGGKRVLLG